MSTYETAYIRSNLEIFGEYRPSLSRRVWMPDGSSEPSEFQKRRRLKHTAL